MATPYTAGGLQLSRSPTPTSGMERAMSTSLWLVKTRCTDPAREAAFNRWYTETHLPDLLTVPHVVSAQRFKLAGPPSAGEPADQYLALYELETDDPQAVVTRYFTEYGPQLRAA